MIIFSARFKNISRTSTRYWLKSCRLYNWKNKIVRTLLNLINTASVFVVSGSNFINKFSILQMSNQVDRIRIMILLIVYSFDRNLSFSSKAKNCIISTYTCILNGWILCKTIQNKIILSLRVYMEFLKNKITGKFHNFVLYSLWACEIGLYTRSI